MRNKKYISYDLILSYLTNYKIESHKLLLFICWNRKTLLKIMWNYILFIIWVIFISNQNKFQRLTTKLEFQFFHSLLWSWRQKCLDVSFSLCTWHGLFSVWFDTILIHVGMISSNKFVDLKHLWQVIYIFPPLGFIYAYTSYK